MATLALAKTIDHALLQPSLTDREFEMGCDVALRFGVAALCVKSIDVKQAAKRLLSSSVAVCSVVGFPHANCSTRIVVQEISMAMQEGANEIDAVVPLSRVLSNDWDAVRDHVAMLNECVRTQSGILKVIFETGLIADRAAIIRLCEICKSLEVAYVKTSTGFATARNADGQVTMLGATADDVKLLVEHAGPVCQVKASGGIRTRAQVERFIELGATRIGTAATSDILRE